MQPLPKPGPKTKYGSPRHTSSQDWCDGRSGSFEGDSSLGLASPAALQSRPRFGFKVPGEPMWVKILHRVVPSVTNAIERISPPQRGHSGGDGFEQTRQQNAREETSRLALVLSASITAGAGIGWGSGSACATTMQSSAGKGQPFRCKPAARIGLPARESPNKRATNPPTRTTQAAGQARRCCPCEAETTTGLR
jgi:hypothetical protein